jgi:hypothetical protein
VGVWERVGVDVVYVCVVVLISLPRMCLCCALHFSATRTRCRWMKIMYVGNTAVHLLLAACFSWTNESHSRLCNYLWLLLTRAFCYLFLFRLLPCVWRYCLSGSLVATSPQASS